MILKKTNVDLLLFKLSVKPELESDYAKTVARSIKDFSCGDHFYWFMNKTFSSIVI